MHQYQSDEFKHSSVMGRRAAGQQGGVRALRMRPQPHAHFLPSLLRSCVAERSPAGSTAWPTSVPACHSSRAACPKSGWRPRPCSPASARSCTAPASWRRRRTPPPPPRWRPCRRAHPPPHPALPLCAATLATSPAGRTCEVGLRALNCAFGEGGDTPALPQAAAAGPSRGGEQGYVVKGKEVLVLQVVLQRSSFWSKSPFTSREIEI